MHLMTCCLHTQDKVGEVFGKIGLCHGAQEELTRMKEIMRELRLRQSLVPPRHGHYLRQ